MSTFLELAQTARDECEIPGTGPVSVVSQVGQLARVVRYVKQSWTEIQNKHATWRWMRVGFTLVTTASDDKYAYTDATDTETAATIARFGHWRLNDQRDPPRIYLTATGVSAEYLMSYVPYDAWKLVYEISSQSDSQPAHITVDPLNNIRLGPAPDASYTLTGEYLRGAQVLALDADTPDMPSRFHELIVYGAMIKWGYFANAPELVQSGLRQYSRMMDDLTTDQLPQMSFGTPLA